MVSEKYPISEFHRELVHATMRACGSLDEPDLDAITADAIDRTNSGLGWPFTLVVYHEGDCDTDAYCEESSFALLSEAVAATGRELHNGCEPDNMRLFYGQPLDISSYQAEQLAAMAAEKARQESAWRERQARENAIRLAEQERYERATLATLKAKYGA